MIRLVRAAGPSESGSLHLTGPGVSRPRDRYSKEVVTSMAPFRLRATGQPSAWAASARSKASVRPSGSSTPVYVTWMRFAAFDSDRQINGLGCRHPRRPQRAPLGNHSAPRRRPRRLVGVRLFTDGWTPDRPATDPEDLVLQAELLASRRDPYRRLSRLFHLIGRRPS